MRPAILLVLLTIALPAVAGAAAPQEKQACIAASEKAQQLRADSKLLKSREQLLTCARDVCPAVVRKDCARWLGEVEEALPTVVLAAKDAGGHDVAAVKVTVDDQPFAEKLDGKAQPIDPGSHVFKFAPETGPVISETVLVREGEKNRIISITFPGPKKDPATDTGKSDVAPVTTISPAAWVFTGVGAVSLVSFAYFGLSARSQASDLRASCAPACATDDVDSVKGKLLIADISLGVSLVSFGIATYFFLNPTTTETKSVAFSPLPGGGAFHFGGSF